MSWSFTNVRGLWRKHEGDRYLWRLDGVHTLEQVAQVQAAQGFDPSDYGCADLEEGKNLITDVTYTEWSCWDSK